MKIAPYSVLSGESNFVALRVDAQKLVKTVIWA